VEKIKPVLAANVVLMILFSMAVCFTTQITTSKAQIPIVNIIATRQPRLLTDLSAYGITSLYIIRSVYNI
jgi:uncharacterized membrane protein